MAQITNPSEIAMAVIDKSGTIKMASLIHIWTHWANYTSAEIAKPSVKQLCEAT